MSEGSRKVRKTEERVKDQEPGVKIKEDKGERTKAKGGVKARVSGSPVPDANPSESKDKHDPDNTSHATEQMEVHHHPQLHHKPKPWKEYLLEGLMIFIAVTMGFFAESLREHINNNEREKQYIRAMVADLKDDEQNLQMAIKNLDRNKIMLDSLELILNDPEAIPSHGDDLYYYGRLGPRINTLAINMRTYEQLKNSGNFRLISKVGVSNDIMDYYQKVPFMQQIESLYMEEFASYKKIAANVFEPAVFMRQETEKGDVIKGHDNPSLQKGALLSVKQLSVFAIYMNGSRKQILTNDKDMLKSANTLLNSLQKAYHLEDD